MYSDTAQVLVLDEEPLAADGTFVVDVPADAARIVVDARGDAGELLGSALVARSGAAGQTLSAPPVDAETTLESDVYTAFVNGGGQPAAIDVVDLRMRVDADLAVALVDRHDGDVDAVAQGVAAAQAAELAGLTAAGFEITASDLYDLRVPAAVAYDDALYDGDDPFVAWDAFLDDLAAEIAMVGVDAEQAFEVESEAGVAMRSQVRALLGPGDASEAVADTGAAIEANQASAAVIAATAASGSADAVAVASAAADALEVGVRDPADLEEAATQWDDFRLALIGPPVEGAALGLVATDASLDAAVAASEAAAADLEAGADVAASASAGDTAELGDAIVALWQVFAADTRSQIDAVVASDEESGPAGDLTVVAAGGFRATGPRAIALSP